MVCMLRRRYQRIRNFFTRILLSTLWWEVALPRLGLRKLSKRTRSERMKRMAVEFRGLAVHMGGVMIKVGQFLSARLDVMPPEIVSELSGLQDEVGAESFSDIRKVIEAEFNEPLESRFIEFAEVPMASASIGQVHVARLCVKSPQGKPCPSVVVKVQRPNIDQIIATDLEALRHVGKLVNRYEVVRRRVNVPALLEEFNTSLLEETDYLHEGRNAETFAANFKGRRDLCIPKVIWSHTTRRVLTLEDVRGIKITDYAGIETVGIDRREVAQRLLDTYLQQVFEDGFFHADPHPGNLFVQPAPTRRDPNAWQLTFVDFGMTGTLPPETRHGLREILFSVGTRDAERLVNAYQLMGFLLPNADLDLIERANARMFEQLWGKSMNEMMQMHPRQATEFAHEFADLIYEMPFQMPEHLILFGRMVSILSGMCTGLDPEFNVWRSLAPYAQKLLSENGESGFEVLAREAGDILRTLVGLPKKADKLMNRLEQGKVDVRVPELRERIAQLERSQHRTNRIILFGVFLLVATQFFIAGQLWPAGGFALLALLFLLVLLLRR
jgi:predicted unusual protein kinase regulating ubiquinone biosynthesis (AarF/ABC1/UbiB family)